jgi:hypothetical protein
MRNSIFRGILLACVMIPFLFKITDAAQQFVAFWSFDSVSADTYYDVTGHGYDAKGTGSGFSIISGVKDDALNCSGSGFDIAIANSKDSFVINKFTIELWFYSNIILSSEIVDQQKIFDFTNASSGVRNGYSIGVMKSGKFHFSLASSDGSRWVECPSTAVLASKKWYHLAASYDSTYLRVYVDGVLNGSTPNSGPIRPVGFDARIGCQFYNNGTTIRFLINGRIDELKLYNYALSADTIRAHFNTFSTKPTLIPCSPNPTYNQQPYFRWYAKNTIDLYRIQIDTNQRFVSPIFSLPTTDTFFVPSVKLSIDTIYWRVGDDADTSAWSEPLSVIILDPAIPILIPFTSDPTRNRKPQLMWHTVENATSYTIQINTTPSFASPLIVDAAVDTNYVPAANLPIGIIYWRVKSNLSSQYSLMDTFTIQSDSVPLIIPMDPDTQYSTKPVFYWHPATGASSYRIQIDTIGNFVNPFISLPVEDTTYEPSVDLPFARIFWRVSANTNSNLYSEIDTFWIEDQTALGSGLTVKKTGVSMLRSLRHGVMLAYSLDKPGKVSLTLYSIAGSFITRIEKESASSAASIVLWNGTDRYGRSVPNGSYCVVCIINGRTFSKIISLMR